MPVAKESGATIYLKFIWHMNLPKNTSPVASWPPVFHFASHYAHLLLSFCASKTDPTSVAGSVNGNFVILPYGAMTCQEFL